jgi:hypothetical protein
MSNKGRKMDKRRDAIKTTRTRRKKSEEHLVLRGDNK